MSLSIIDPSVLIQECGDKADDTGWLDWRVKWEPTGGKGRRGKGEEA